MTSEELEKLRADEATVRKLLAALDEARAQLAALHAAVARWRDTPRRPECDLGTCGACGVCLLGGLRTALADTATAAAEHERRVRADERVKALRDAEGTLDIAAALAERDRAPAEASTLRAVAHRLRAMADEAERGTR